MVEAMLMIHAGVGLLVILGGLWVFAEGLNASN